MRSGSEASVCDGMCHAERCKARAQASYALLTDVASQGASWLVGAQLASIASTNLFLMACDEKVTATCHAERSEA